MCLDKRWLPSVEGAAATKVPTKERPKPRRKAVQGRSWLRVEQWCGLARARETSSAMIDRTGIFLLQIAQGTQLSKPEA